MAEYKTVRQSTKQLLGRSEGFDVDFKKQADNLKAEEFVAFANSASGGSLLIGVDEEADAQGRQRGKIVGCRVDDEARLMIQNKASDCSPPIEVVVCVENTNDLPFLRVDIPSGDMKPYCTPGGRYMTRGDGRKLPLLPQELLTVFLQERAEEFAVRFREATSSLQSDIDTLQDEVQRDLWRVAASVEEQFSEFQSVSERIEEVQYEINSSLDPIAKRLEGIFDSAQNAESLSDDAMNAASEAAWETEGLRRNLQNLHQDVYHLAWKLNALLENSGVEDPEITRKRNHTRMGAELIFKTIAQRDKPGGGRYSVEEAKEAYDQYAERLIDRPEMRQSYLEYVTVEDARRWLEEGEGESEEDPPQAG